MSDAYFKSCMCLSELAIESVFVDRKETTTKNKQTNNQANTNKQTNKQTNKTTKNTRKY